MTIESDFNNQINNVLAFPGIFRGALDARASAITEEMKLAAAYGIASLVDDSELCAEYIIPKAFDERVEFGRFGALSGREAWNGRVALGVEEVETERSARRVGRRRAKKRRSRPPR